MGIYVVMFLEILQTLIKVLLIFSILIIAFGLAFYILLSRVRQIACTYIRICEIYNVKYDDCLILARVLRRETTCRSTRYLSH